jgi:hypothetical protein
LNTINLQTILYKMTFGFFSISSTGGIMKFQFDGLEDIRARLLRLERQNRRLKQLGTAMLIVFASLSVMGQAPSRKVIEANEFILRDESGNVRARLSMNATLNPEMILLDEKGKIKLKLEGGIGQAADIGGFVSVFDGLGQERGMLSADTYAGGVLSLSEVKGSSFTLLKPGEVTVSDTQGFKAAMGTQELVTPRTGEEHKTSAASLILFDKDKNVLWKAP